MKWRDKKKRSIGRTIERERESEGARGGERK